MDIATARRILTQKSPFAPKDTRPRCEECRRVLVKVDYDSYTDGGSIAVKGPPRICERCAEDAECKSV